MRYLYCIIPPILLQLLAVYIIVVMNTGNGSWLGLGAILFAMPIIPTTVAVNFIMVNKNVNSTPMKLILLSNFIAFLIPILIIGLFIIVVLIEGLIGQFF
ncbi:MAG: hypothetical protein AAF410_00715 [Pseudomonadota bacterium]